MVGLGADAGNPDQGLELLLEVGPMRLEIGVHAIHGIDRLSVAMCQGILAEPGSRGTARHDERDTAFPVLPKAELQYITGRVTGRRPSHS